MAVTILAAMACTSRDDGVSQHPSPSRVTSPPNEVIHNDTDITLGDCKLRLVHGLDAAKNLSESGPLIAYVRSDTCTACESLDSTIGDAICANSLQDKTIVADLGGIGGSSVPMLQLLDRGVIIDEQLGAQLLMNKNAASINIDNVDHFLIRNGLAVGNIHQIESRRGTLPWRSRQRRSLSGRGVSLIVMDNEDLSGWKIKNAIVAGCSLRGTDLRNADLSYSFFSHTDLTGANLSGTRMEDVRWNHVTCPDGHFSPHGPCGPAAGE